MLPELAAVLRSCRIACSISLWLVATMAGGGSLHADDERGGASDGAPDIVRKKKMRLISQ